jgi:RNA polymerase sigma-70 factor (ECF subfamily)
MEIEYESSQSDDDFAELLALVRQGDESAASRLVERYERAVLRSVRRRLGKNMRGALDSMDVMQSVHRSLLVGLRNEKYQFSTPQQLIGLAVAMVQSKIARHWRKIKKMPSIMRETNIAEQGTLVERLAVSDPTASLQASAKELLQQFLAQLDELDQELVRLKLAGNSSVDTAKLLNCKPAFIRMRWVRLRRTLRQNGYSLDDPN